MTRKRLIAKLASVKPTDVSSLIHECGLAIKFLESGSYRAVYEIVGMNLVVKIPLYGHRKRSKVYRFNVEHAQAEWYSFHKIRNERKFSRMRKYLPKIYHFDRETGLTLMEKYELAKDTTRISDERYRLQEELISLLEVEDPDVDNLGNLAQDKKGQLKFIDMGLFIDN